MQTTLDRFMSKVTVDDSTGCWEWQNYKDATGYGQLKHKGKTSFAHRVSYELKNGTIPNGIFIMHTCDNRGCVNPDHLTTGTHTENMRDMTAKGRQGNQILRLSDVVAIKKFLERRTLGKNGRMEHRACQFLADWFGVKRSAISGIVSGRSWKYIN